MGRNTMIWLPRYNQPSDGISRAPFSPDELVRRIESRRKLSFTPPSREETFPIRHVVAHALAQHQLDVVPLVEDSTAYYSGRAKAVVADLGKQFGGGGIH